jgi:hypothetical protein
LNEGQFRKDTFVEVGGRAQKEKQAVVSDRFLNPAGGVIYRKKGGIPSAEKEPRANAIGMPSPGQESSVDT